MKETIVGIMPGQVFGVRVTSVWRGVEKARANLKFRDREGRLLGTYRGIYGSPGDEIDAIAEAPAGCEEGSVSWSVTVIPSCEGGKCGAVGASVMPYPRSVFDGEVSICQLPLGHEGKHYYRGESHSEEWGPGWGQVTIHQKTGAVISVPPKEKLARVFFGEVRRGRW